jgi:hypothetical protein
MKINYRKILFFKIQRNTCPSPLNNLGSARLRWALPSCMADGYPTKGIWRTRHHKPTTAKYVFGSEVALGCYRGHQLTMADHIEGPWNRDTSGKHTTTKCTSHTSLRTSYPFSPFSICLPNWMDQGHQYSAGPHTKYSALNPSMNYASTREYLDQDSYEFGGYKYLHASNSSYGFYCMTS